MWKVAGSIVPLGGPHSDPSARKMVKSQARGSVVANRTFEGGKISGAEFILVALTRPPGEEDYDVSGLGNCVYGPSAFVEGDRGQGF